MANSYGSVPNGIVVNGVTYLTRTLVDASGQEFVIAQESLESILLDAERQDAVDDEAERIDNTIFYYAQDHYFVSDEKLIAKMNHECQETVFINVV